jgi:alkylated DNA repair dioxygenase AlkB
LTGRGWAGRIELVFALQGSLLGGDDPGVDHEFRYLDRTWLDPTSWLDLQPGWLHGADHLFAALVRALPWRHRTVRMYERRLPEPRLTAWCPLPHAQATGAWDLPVLHQARRALEQRYGVALPWVGANWYRDGRDSVAWHRDRTRFQQDEPLVAIVSLGAPRPFLVRPLGGGRSRRWAVGGGDLLVMGGRAQQDWEHHVPKVSVAGPRISVMFRDQPG